jgi:hypothetical protein
MQDIGTEEPRFPLDLGSADREVVEFEVEGKHKPVCSSPLRTPLRFSSVLG